MGPVAELVLDRVGAIAPLLDEAMASAILQAEKRAHGLAHERYPHLRPLTIRADVREALMVESLPKGWHIDGDSRKMAQLILVYEVSGMSLRMLKAPYTQQDRVPYAGASRARREVWAQQPLPDVSAQSTLADAETLTGHVFLLLWAYVDPADRVAGYILRVVHTLVPGAFGKSTPCDLDLIIPRGGRIDVGDLAFSGSDGEEDLFLFDLPADVEEDMA